MFTAYNQAQWKFNWNINIILNSWLKYGNFGTGY